MAKKKDSGAGIPQHEVESLARLLLPAMRAFFESEEGQWEFREWKEQQAEKAAREGSAPPKPKD